MELWQNLDMNPPFLLTMRLRWLGMRGDIGCYFSMNTILPVRIFFGFTFSHIKFY